MSNKLTDYLRKQTTESLKELAVAQSETVGGYTALQHTLEVIRERMDESTFRIWLAGTNIDV